MRVALDASYSVDSQPTGIAIYSQELMGGLAATYPAHQFVYCYRPKFYRRAESSSRSNAARAILLPPLRTFSADIFHALNQRVDRRPSAKVVATFHDLFVMTGDYSSPEFRERFCRQARAAAAQSDLIIAVSEFTASQVTSLLGIPRSRVRVVPHGVHAASPTPHVKREKLVLFLGAVQVRKNVRRLVEAFSTMDPSWRLVLAGAPAGYGAPEILKFIEGCACRSRIEIAGYVSPQVRSELFARASIFAFPSLDEGFGIPVLEAMSAGVPVITSNGSALVEVADGAARLIDPLDADELGEALRTVAADQPLREKMIDAGRKRAALFTWEDAVRKTFAVYRELT